MIPKIIHFVWVGGKPFPPLVKKCIKTWKKFCPDFEIKMWNENNFDLNSNLYCKQAIENKKWAFASDFIRLKALYEFGGIYLDTDVQITKKLDDLLSNKAFIGFETEEFLSTAVIAAEKENPWIKKNLDYYQDRSFIKEDGTMDVTTNVVTLTNITKNIYKEFKLNNQLQTLKDLTIYPKDYFCPIDYNTQTTNPTKNTHAIHHFSGSWLPKQNFFKKFIRKCKNLIKKIIGKKNVEKIKKRREEKKSKTKKTN